MPCHRRSRLLPLPKWPAGSIHVGLEYAALLGLDVASWGGFNFISLRDLHAAHNPGHC